MPSSSDPTEPLRAHFRKERNAIDQHPSPERIVAYHERRLAPGETEDIREHLAACPDCTTQLLELAALLDGEEATGPEISRAELDTAWQRQKARLFPPSPVVSLESRRPRAPLRWAWATAASMGLAAALLVFVVVDQRRTIEQLARPQANPPLVNLVPAGSVRQGLPEVTELRLPADAERAWVILYPAELDFPSYDVEVVAPKGEVVLRLKDLQSSEANNFRLEIPRAALRTTGDYKILLLGKKEGQRQVVEEFALRVH